MKLNPQESEKIWHMRLVLLVLFTIILRSMFMSVSLDDFDSRNFACAVQKFDLSQGCPFWPPYIVYIWLGKFFHILGLELLTALIAPNVILGAAGLFFVYGLAKRYIPPKESFLCALLVAVNPLLWVASEIVMSDTTSYFFVLGYLYFLLDGKNKSAAFFLAFALGTRPWNVLFAFLVVYQIGITTKPYVAAIKKTAVFAIWTGIFSLLWLIPLIYTIGLDNLPRDQNGVWYASSQETIFAKNPVYSPLMRFAVFAYVNGYQLGINPIQLGMLNLLSKFEVSDQITLGEILLDSTVDIAGLVGLIIVSIFLAKGLGRKDMGFMKLWLFPLLVWTVLMQTPYNSRYIASLIPPLVILLIAGYHSIKKGNKHLARYCFILLFVIWFSRGFYLSNVLHTIPSPSVQEVYFVKQNFPNATVIGYGETAFFDWYAPEINHFDVGYKGVTSRSIPSGSEVLINARAAYYLRVPTANCFEFTRDPMAHFKHAYVRLCALNNSY